MKDTTVGGSMIVRNVFGRLERLRATVGGSPNTVANVQSKPSPGSSKYSEVELTRPFLYDLTSSLHLRGFVTEDDISYTVKRRGSEIKVDFPLGSIGYEGTWREVKTNRKKFP